MFPHPPGSITTQLAKRLRDSDHILPGFAEPAYGRIPARATPPDRPFTPSYVDFRPIMMSILVN
jgi:hypothetical protein